MTSFDMDRVSVEFPIYGGHSRSLKKTLAYIGSRGRIGRDVRDRVIVQALTDISLSAQNGERIGLIGPNGAGKTTLLRVLAGIYEPTRGTVRRSGHVVPLFGTGLGMDVEATGYENIVLGGALLGLDPAEVREKTEDIAAFTELGDYLAVPVRTYSEGMLLRLAFAISTCIEPDILLLDEWIGVGDVRFLEKAERRLDDIVERSSILVIATHSEKILRRLCSKAIYLEAGQVREIGPVDAVYRAYSQAA